MKKVFPILIFVILCFSLVYSMNEVNASNGLEDFSFNTSLEITEHYDKTGSGTSENEISIDILSPSLTVKDLEINFTDIKYPIQNLSIIENNPIDSKQIEKDFHGYAVQLKLNEPTNIYGINIYIRNANPSDPAPRPIYVMIKGFDKIGNKPNNTIFGEYTLLNKSDTGSSPGWFIQEFPSPILLKEGNYSLVLNGSAIGSWPQTQIDWYYNDVNPSHPELYTSALSTSGVWSAGIQGEPFLYKIIYESEVTPYPEEINMTAEINANSYKIFNGTNKGEGILEKNDINLAENDKTLQININNNISNNLTFDYTYNLDIFADFPLEAIGSKAQNQNILWTLNPSITRKSDYMTIRFNYPHSWSNLTIFKNDINITPNITINPEENYILFPNDTIKDGADWEIRANSPKTDIALNTPILEFETSQELRFELSNPILPGNYTLILFDSFGLEIYRIVKTIPPDNNLFSYEIPENTDEGIFIAYVVWNNNTDAGLAEQEFRIVKAAAPPSSPNGNNFLSIIIGVVIGGGSIVGLSSIIGFKKYKNSKRKKLEDFLKKCSELLNIKSIIVTEKSSGIDLYSKSFSENKIDGTLLSGFFQAIRNFGEEALEGFENSRTVKLEYKKYVILMNDFVNTRVIVVMKEQPSTNFEYILDDLSYDIYMNYGDKIDNFKGNVKDFRGIENLIEKYLNIDLLYPYKINPKNERKLKLSDKEKKIIQRARNFMRDNDTDYFYSVYLLPENQCEPEDFEILKTLIDKGIFQSIKNHSKKDIENPLSVS